MFLTFSNMKWLWEPYCHTEWAPLWITSNSQKSKPTRWDVMLIAKTGNRVLFKPAREICITWHPVFCTSRRLVHSLFHFLKSWKTPSAGEDAIKTPPARVWHNTLPRAAPGPPAPLMWLGCAVVLNKSPVWKKFSVSFDAYEYSLFCGPVC